MKTKTELQIELLTEARTRLSNQLENIKEEDLKKKLGLSPNSVGFLLRHIGDVELLFSKNVFGAADIKVTAKTVIDKRDTGEWTNLGELIEYIKYSFESLRTIVEKQTDADWEIEISTKEFGTKSKIEAFGRIVSHTAYHAGQIAIINKYGIF
ncbi:DinB family protein [Lacihabitans sp. LS3-19]|uniref:DinB family protein n=1 Tax=Lacihabitans sp. LS3-19 TaxID=2487335 RepID=UPI0020CF65B3|nr:DinB family protein [Lacihabitans sp. LS3-19]MCP9768562.1 DinB family protein [Lacihabitans sp. LS3-19]